MESLEIFLSKQTNKKEINEYKKNIFNYLIDEFLPESTIKKEQFEKWFGGYFKNFIFSKNIDLFFGESVEKNEFLNKLPHYVDYLNSAQSKKRFDRMTWEELGKQVDEWDSWLEKKALDGDDPHGCSLTNELSDGWVAMELKTSKALYYEGGTMGHCVGSYGDKIESGKSIIYSLRDKRFNSHITVELNVERNEVVQIQGKSNKKPIEKYHKYLFEFIVQNKFNISSGIIKKYNVRQVGAKMVPNDRNYIKELISYINSDSNGGVLDLSDVDLGDNVIQGNYDLVTINGNSKGVKIINSDIGKLTIEGQTEKLDFENVNIDDLKIKNTMSLFSLKGINVTRNLILENTMISSIPEYDLLSLRYIGNKLNALNEINCNFKNGEIKNAKNLKSIPAGKYVSLELFDTGVLDLSNISSRTIRLSSSPVVNLDLNNFESGTFDSIGIKAIKGLSAEKDKKVFYFKNCNNLQNIEDIKAPFSKLVLQNNNIKVVKGVSCAYLNLDFNPLETLEKTRVNSISLKGVDMNKVAVKRVNVKKIKTNDREFIKNRSFKNKSRP